MTLESGSPVGPGLRITRPLLALGAALVLLAAACGEQPAGGGGTGDDGRIDHPTGANDLVLRMNVGGGLMPIESSLRGLPALSLYGDGTLILPGPQIEIYPAPALPSLVATEVSEDGIQAILRAARDAGLLGPDRHLDYPLIADAPTTTFTVVAAGATHTVSAYALGEAQGADGIPAEDADVRAALAELQSKLFDLRSWLPEGSVGDERTYEPSALRVFVRPYGEVPDSTLEQPPVDWPLAEPLARFGSRFAGLADTRCGVVEEGELTSVLAIARATNELTPWRSGGETYQLIFRPLLPDESGC